MKIAAIAFTERGIALACQLHDALSTSGHRVEVSGPARFSGSLGIEAYESLDAWCRDSFAQAEALLFVSATGIAVRGIAPYVKDKFSDPAVVSVDEAGSFVVPLLSGHVGGANDFAREVAAACGGQAVVSTATDVNGLFAVDEWSRKQNLAILDRTAAKEVAAALLAGTPVGFASEFAWEGALPAGLVAIKPPTAYTPGKDASLLAADEDASSPEASEGVPHIGISISLDPNKHPFATTLRLAPRSVCVGVGCRRGAPAEKIAALVDSCLEKSCVAPQAVCALASIDMKADETGLLALANRRGWQALFYTAEELAAVPGEFAGSEFVAKTVGVDNVCERAACAAAGPDAKLLLPRHASDGVTAALAARPLLLRF